MPTLPEREEPPAGRVERVGEAMRRAGAAIGADARVGVRTLVFLVVVVVCTSMASAPWAQIGLVALLGIALDIARQRRHP